MPIIVLGVERDKTFVEGESIERMWWPNPEKGSGTKWCEAPEGPFRLLVPDPFSGPNVLTW